jgi:hypothetical protein
MNDNNSIVFNSKSSKVAYLANYLFATKELGMSEESAKGYARTEFMRDKFFYEAFRQPQNISIKFLYYIPVLVFISLFLIGFLMNPKWIFYGPALFFILLWVISRKWSTFWIPYLYFLNPLVNYEKDNLGFETDWRSYFVNGKATITMMINACHDSTQPLPTRTILRSMFIQSLCWIIFLVLTIFAWKQ